MNMQYLTVLVVLTISDSKVFKSLITCTAKLFMSQTSSDMSFKSFDLVEVVLITKSHLLEH